MPAVTRFNNSTNDVASAQGASSYLSGLLAVSTFTQGVDPIYGTGLDGDVTLDGSSTVLSMAPSSSVYTMTRDIFCNNLTLNASVTLKPAGYRIFVRGILTLGSSSTIGFTTGFSTAGSIHAGGATATAVTHSLGGASATQTATVPIDALGGSNYYKQAMFAYKGWSVSASNTTPTFLRGGAGGSSGAGGGVVIICARYIVVSSGTSTFSALGTSGAGGGGGGVIIVISSADSLNASVTTSVTGGTSCSSGTANYIQLV